MDAAGINLYCVTTSTRSYPERLAYQLLHDVMAVAMEEHSMASVGEFGLNKRLGPIMKALVSHYEDLAASDAEPPFKVQQIRCGVGH